MGLLHYSCELIGLSPLTRQSANRPCKTKQNKEHNNDHQDFHNNFKGKNGPNLAAWQQLSEIEKKARGVLGVFKLKAHVGRLNLNSKVLFCFGSVALLTHHTSTSVKL